MTAQFRRQLLPGFAGLAGALVAAGDALAAPPAVPRPHGWIGTTNDWAHGLGVGFAILDLILLLVAWRQVARVGLTPGLKRLLALALVAVPLAVVFFGYAYGLEASKTVDACGSCHVMGPFVADLRNPKSDSLAALHFKNRYIQENHCYTCHTNYGMFGTFEAKWDGLGHVIRNTTGRYETPIRIEKPYPNVRCLGCHAESQKFRDPEKHPAEEMPKLLSGETGCLDCHGPAHDVAAPEGKK